MPGTGGHRFYFVGKVPPVFSVVVLLLFANTFLMLLLEFAGKYILPREVPETVRWYRNNSIPIQFVLLALLAAILIIFRKRVEWWPSSKR
jgi:hypothetical protein